MNAQHLLASLHHAKHDQQVVAVVDGEKFPVTFVNTEDGALELHTGPEPTAKPSPASEVPKKPAPGQRATPAAPAPVAAAEAPADENLELGGEGQE
jgi:hypothetical protein